MRESNKIFSQGVNNNDPASQNISFTPQSVSITIKDDENPPVAIADNYDGSNCVLEGGKLNISDPALGLLANDYDPEGGTLSIKIKGESYHFEFKKYAKLYKDGSCACG